MWEDGDESSHPVYKNGPQHDEHSKQPADLGDGGSSSTSTSTLINNTTLSSESIYHFYRHELFPALAASIPILFYRLSQDTYAKLAEASHRFVKFLIPWSSYSESAGGGAGLNLTAARVSSAAFLDKVLTYFDADDDGHMSRIEIARMKEMLPDLDDLLGSIQIQIPGLQGHVGGDGAAWSWWQQAWPMMDWKIGVFLWRSCGGLLLVIFICSIVPGRLHGISGRMLRIPFLVIMYLMIAVELVVYVAIRLVIKLAEALFANSKHRAWRRQMERARSYDEWYAIAKKLDVSKGRDRWQRSVEDETSSRYNWMFIRELMNDMRSARRRNDSLQALAVLQQCTRKNVGGVMSEDLFTYTNTGETKYIVNEFIYEVATTLRWITTKAKDIRPKKNESFDGEVYEEELKSQMKAEKEKLYRGLASWATLSVFGAAGKSKDASQPAQDRSSPAKDESPTAVIDSSSQRLPSHHRETVRTFLKRARAAYGRTALCLSGGGMMGNYHWGTVKALLEEDCLPHIISGTSAGSVVAALVCTRTDEEITRDLDPDVLVEKQKCFSRPWPDRIRSVCRDGHIFDGDEWYRLIKWFTCGDMTFEEAYKKTGRVFCITLSATTKKAPPVLLNYISAPNVVIASAIIASAAVPGFLKPVLLKVKDSNGVVRDQGENKDQTYWDGSIEQDIPTAGLAEMLNCQFFVASQNNPHIVPFVYNSKGDVGRPSRWSSGLRDDSWRGGFLLSALELYLKNDMRAKFKFLNDLEGGVEFFSAMFSQASYSGTTTVVPNVAFQDFFKLFSNPSLDDMKRYFQGGSVAAYAHCAMVKLHYEIANTLDECLVALDEDEEKDKENSVVAQFYEGNGEQKPGKSPNDNHMQATATLVDVGHGNTPPRLLPSRCVSYNDFEAIEGVEDVISLKKIKSKSVTKLYRTMSSQ